jgi:hypothetical protein
MNTAVFLSVLAQIGLVVFMAVRLGRLCLGRIGFLFVVASFAYHGLPEILLACFPNSTSDAYRDYTDPGYLTWWILLVTLGLITFGGAYLLTARNPVNADVRYSSLIAQLDKVYLLRWQMIVALAVPDFLFVALSAQDSGGYWLTGLSAEYVPYLVALSFATFALKYKGRGFEIAALFYIALMALSGERSRVLGPVILTLSALARYGIVLSWRRLVVAAVLVGSGFVAISLTRSLNGRFAVGEGLDDRLSAIAGGITEAADSVNTAVLDDTVYRVDGNSFAAIILERQQSQGYASTGFTQLIATIRYMIPSFLFRSKMALDVSLRDEEGYDDWFYDLPDVDWLPTVWGSLLCYAGPFGLVVFAALLGWTAGQVDNWLFTIPTVNSYLIGIWISLIPLTIEWGVSAIIVSLRGMLPVLLVGLIGSRLAFGGARLKPTPLLLTRDPSNGLPKFQAESGDLKNVPSGWPRSLR